MLESFLNSWVNPYVVFLPYIISGSVLFMVNQSLAKNLTEEISKYVKYELGNCSGL